MAAAPPRTKEAALAVAAPVYLAIGPVPVAVPETPATGLLVPVASAQVAHVDEAPVAASGVLVTTVEALYE